MAKNLNEELQSAYKAEHSTETALLRVHNGILMSVDEKEAAVLVLLYLSAAFDTIDHNVLFTRLNKMYGLKGTAIDWFRSYLNNRSQAVSIKDSLSVK